MAKTAVSRSAEDLFRRLVGQDMADVGLDQLSLLHLSGDSGLAGEYQGEDAILGLLGRMVELTDATLRVGTTQVLVADGQTVVLCGRLVGSRRRQQLDTHALRIVAVRGHTIRDMWIFHQDQDAVDDFWTEEKCRVNERRIRMKGGEHQPFSR